MIYGFDFDGTLVKTWTAEPLPGVKERLTELSTDMRTFIATNQAGPVFRAVTNDPKYPTVEDVAGRIADGLVALNWKPDLLLVAVHSGKIGGEWDDAANRVNRLLTLVLRGTARIREVSAWPEYRKPWPRMLTNAAQLLEGSVTDMLYIGDMESDRLAAEAAGARFLDAEAWRNGTAVLQ